MGPPTVAGPDPGRTAAAIAAGVLALWTPFTGVYALVLVSQTDCSGSSVAICRPWGHLAASYAGPAAAVLGLVLVGIGSWVIRRRHTFWALIGLGVAAIGFVITLGLAVNAPPVWSP